MTRAGSRRPLAGWLVADVVSVTGTRVSMIAIPLFVLLSTGSATRTGLVAVAELTPLILLKALSGPVIDQVGARRVAVFCDLASTVVVATIPVLYDVHGLSFPVFLAIVAVAGALRGPGDAAKSALAPSVAETAQVPMERVTGLSGTVERTATMAGAGLGGLLVAMVGPAQAIVVDAVSFAVSAAVLWWGTAGLVPVVAEEAETPDTLPYLQRLKAGWDHLRGDRLLLSIAVMVALTNLLDQAWMTVLMPVWVVDTGRGAAVLGLLLAVWSALSALGALAAALWAARLPRYAVYVVAFLIAGLPRFVATGLGAPMWLLLAIFALGGLSSGFLNPIIGAIVFERIPAALVGRVSSLITSLAFGLMPLGGLLGGLLVDGIGLTPTFLAIGVAYFLVTMVPAADASWRELDRRPQVSSVA